MIYFLDTEFTNFVPDMELISIGLVSEDGTQEFYAEITDYNHMLCSPFVREIVLPLLGKEGFKGRKHEVAQKFNEWIEAQPDPLVVVYDYNGDWYLFGELELHCAKKHSKKVYGRLLEPALRHCLHERGFHDPQQHSDAFKDLVINTENYYYVDSRVHHALVDAKANRHGWVKAFEHIK